MVIISNSISVVRNPAVSRIALVQQKRCRQYRQQPVRCQQMNMKDVSAKEAGQFYQDGYQYLDVRTPQEYGQGNVPNSVNIPIMFRTEQGMNLNEEFLAQVKEAYPQLDTKLVVGCASGKRSTKACQLLLEEGYKNLVNNSEGYAAWVEAGLPVA
eukprot:TRINITY_DN3255_c1_g1_i1.p2 TRINITY_DN3255_c1_g1~~TRINITY_DN3255_c1_g1_i1.p2  ORF type:complete len:155 (+),score=16.57 TRINITY_DN3255_c1_g1_i1:69-533(+)